MKRMNRRPYQIHLCKCFHGNCQLILFKENNKWYCASAATDAFEVKMPFAISSKLRPEKESKLLRHLSLFSGIHNKQPHSHCLLCFGPSRSSTGRQRPTSGFSLNVKTWTDNDIAAFLHVSRIITNKVKWSHFLSQNLLKQCCVFFSFTTRSNSISVCFSSPSVLCHSLFLCFLSHWHSTIVHLNANVDQ